MHGISRAASRTAIQSSSVGRTFPFPTPAGRLRFEQFTETGPFMTSCIHDHSRWGAGDQIGAAHLLTPEVTLKALRNVRDGEILVANNPMSVIRSKTAPCVFRLENASKQAIAKHWQTDVASSGKQSVASS